MREIKLAFGTDDICLPKNVNEFRVRMPWQEPNSETKIDPDKDEKSLTISPPPTQSIRTIDGLNKEVTDSDTSSPQIQQDSLIHPAPNPSAHPYRMILSKMKEESEQVSTTACTNPPSNVLRNTAVGDNNTISVLYDTLSGQQDPESCVPSAQIEPKPRASQPTVSQTRARGYQHGPATDIADEIKTHMFMLGNSSSDDESRQASPVDNNIFQRVGSQANLTSQRSMLTMQLHNLHRNITMANGASRSSPSLHPSCPSPSTGPSHLDSSGKTEVEPLLTIHGPKSSRPMPVICTTIDTHPHPDLPSTIQRYMLATGLTESLHEAAVSGHEAMVRVLLENGAGVDVQDKCGKTALHGAAVNGHEAVVRLLLENGAGVDVQDKDGETALHGAAASGHEALVRLLLENGAGVNDQSEYGETALYGAAASGHEVVVRLLLENGAGVDDKGKYGETALHGAAASGHEVVVRVLLENGAGVNDQSEYGGTALHGAAASGHEAVVQLLLEKGAGIDDAE